MTNHEMLDAARTRQQQILDASRAAGNERLNDEEQREFDQLQTRIDSLIAAEEAARAAAEAERQRVTEIDGICRSFGIDPAPYINDGNVTVDAARAAVLEHLRKQSPAIPAGNGVVTDEKDKFRAAASDALLLKSGMSVENPAPGATELRGRTLRDLAREAVARDGAMSATDSFRMDDEALLRSFAQPEASFPAILDASINKSVVQAYQMLPTTFDKWTSKGSLSDFKESRDREYLLGSFSEFKELKENGEIVQGTVPDALMPTRKLGTYARSFSLTRQAFIDDDIGFVAALPAKFAESAKRTIEKHAYSLLFNNVTIYDGKALFHADHNNLLASGNAGAPSQALIQKAITLGRKQTNVFGEAILWTPKYLVVPVGYEFDLAVIFRSAQITGSANNDVNPLYNYPLEVVQSPVINNLAGANASPWFLVADPTSCGGIQVDYLNGQETPSVRRMEKPGVLGLFWDVWHDWGINVRDFRGLIRNNGAVVA